MMYGQKNIKTETGESSCVWTGRILNTPT